MRCSPRLTILIAALAAGGCAVYPSAVDQNFGAAVTSATALQKANPGSVGTPVAIGLDGTAARSAVEVYHKSFEAPPAPQNVLNIGVGQSTSR